MNLFLSGGQTIAKAGVGFFNPWRWNWIYLRTVGTIRRQSIEASIWSYLGIALGYVNIILLFPNIFSPDQFGLTRVLIAAASVAANFSLFGTPNIIGKFFPHYSGTVNFRRFLFFCIAVPTILFFIISAGLWFGRGWVLTFYENDSLLFPQYYFLIFPATLALIYLTIYESFLRSNMNVSLPLFVKEVLQRLLTALLIGFYFWKWIGFDVFIYSFVGTYFLCTIVMMIYAAGRHKIIYEWKLRFHSSISELREVFTFGAYALLGNASSMLVNNIDVLMVSMLAGLKQTAIYSVAFLVGTLIQVPYKAMSQIAMPVMSEAWKANDLETIRKLYQRSSANISVIGLLLFLLVWVNIDNLFHFLPEIYRQGKWVIVIVGAAKFIDGITGVNNELISFSKFYRFNFLVILLLVVVTILLNWILIPLYGLPGAAVSTAVAIFIFNAAKYFFILWKFKMQPFDWKTLAVLLAGLFAGGIVYLLPVNGNFILDGFMRSSCILILFLLPVYFFKLAPDMNAFIKMVLNKMK